MRQAASKSGVFHSQEGYFLRTGQDGVWLPVNVTVTRLHVRPRTLAMITARDVRERHETLTQLQVAEEELRRVLSSVSDCLWSVDVDDAGQWTYRYMSPVVESITGRPAEHFRGGWQCWQDIVHPEDRSRWKAAVARLVAGEPVQEEYRILRADGEVRWVRDRVTVNRGPGLRRSPGRRPVRLHRAPPGGGGARPLLHSVAGPDVRGRLRRLLQAR